MSGNVKEFPQKFNPDPDGVGVPCFNVISVPSSVGQVKQIPAILEKIAAEQAGGEGAETGSDFQAGINPRGDREVGDLVKNGAVLQPVLTEGFLVFYRHRCGGAPG